MSGTLSNCLRNRPLIPLFSLFLFHLLLPSGLLKQRSFVTMAQGRHIPTRQNADTSSSQEGERQVVVMRALIGSRPPRCQGRCRSCARCEAVQVPVVPNPVRTKTTSSTTAARVGGAHRRRSASTAYFRGDDLSNYKPMGWKCKCGNLIFNP